MSGSKFFEPSLSTQPELQFSSKQNLNVKSKERVLRFPAWAQGYLSFAPKNTIYLDQLGAVVAFSSASTMTIAPFLKRAASVMIFLRSKQLDIIVIFDDDVRHEISRGKR